MSFSKEDRLFPSLPGPISDPDLAIDLNTTGQSKDTESRPRKLPAHGTYRSARQNTMSPV